MGVTEGLQTFHDFVEVEDYKKEECGAASISESSWTRSGAPRLRRETTSA